MFSVVTELCQLRLHKFRPILSANHTMQYRQLAALFKYSKTIYYISLQKQHNWHSLQRKLWNGLELWNLNEFLNEAATVIGLHQFILSANMHCCCFVMFCLLSMAFDRCEIKGLLTDLLKRRKAGITYVYEVGSIDGVGNVVLESLWMVVDVKHARRLVRHLHDLFTCNSSASVF